MGKIVHDVEENATTPPSTQMLHGQLATPFLPRPPSSGASPSSSPRRAATTPRKRGSWTSTASPSAEVNATLNQSPLSRAGRKSGKKAPPRLGSDGKPVSSSIVSVPRSALVAGGGDAAKSNAGRDSLAHLVGGGSEVGALNEQSSPGERVLANFVDDTVPHRTRVAMGKMAQRLAHEAEDEASRVAEAEGRPPPDPGSLLATPGATIKSRTVSVKVLEGSAAAKQADAAARARDEARRKEVHIFGRDRPSPPGTPGLGRSERRAQSRKKTFGWTQGEKERGMLTGRTLATRGAPLHHLIGDSSTAGGSSVSASGIKTVVRPDVAADVRVAVSEKRRRFEGLVPHGKTLDKQLDIRTRDISFNRDTVHHGIMSPMHFSGSYRGGVSQPERDFMRNLFRHLTPSGRAETVLLGQWMDETVEDIRRAFDRSGNVEQFQQALASTVKTVFGELVRQISVHCVERGVVAVRCWSLTLALMAMDRPLEIDPTRHRAALERIRRLQQDNTRLEEIAASYRTKAVKLVEEIKMMRKRYLSWEDEAKDRVHALERENQWLKSVLQRFADMNSAFLPPPKPPVPAGEGGNPAVDDGDPASERGRHHQRRSGSGSKNRRSGRNGHGTEKSTSSPAGAANTGSSASASASASATTAGISTPQREVPPDVDGHWYTTREEYLGFEALADTFLSYFHETSDVNVYYATRQRKKMRECAVQTPRLGIVEVLDGVVLQEHGYVDYEAALKDAKDSDVPAVERFRVGGKPLGKGSPGSPAARKSKRSGSRSRSKSGRAPPPRLENGNSNVKGAASPYAAAIQSIGGIVPEEDGPLTGLSMSSRTVYAAPHEESKQQRNDHRHGRRDSRNRSGKRHHGRRHARSGSRSRSRSRSSKSRSRTATRSHRDTRRQQRGGDKGSKGRERGRDGRDRDDRRRHHQQRYDDSYTDSAAGSPSSRRQRRGRSASSMSYYSSYSYSSYDAAAAPRTRLPEARPVIGGGSAASKTSSSSVLGGTAATSERADEIEAEILEIDGTLQAHLRSAHEAHQESLQRLDDEPLRSPDPLADRLPYGPARKRQQQHHDRHDRPDRRDDHSRSHHRSSGNSSSGRHARDHHPNHHRRSRHERRSSHNHDDEVGKPSPPSSRARGGRRENTVESPRQRRVDHRDDRHVIITDPLGNGGIDDNSNDGGGGGGGGGVLRQAVLPSASIDSFVSDDAALRGSPHSDIGDGDDIIEEIVEDIADMAIEDHDGDDGDSF